MQSDPKQRGLVRFVQEEVTDKLQLGQGLRHLSQAHPEPSADASSDASQTPKTKPAKGKKKPEKPAGEGGEVSEEERQAEAMREWFPVAEPQPVPDYKLEMCSIMARLRRLPEGGGHTQPARGGWLANGRSLALVASMLACGGRSRDGVAVLSERTLRAAATAASGQEARENTGLMAWPSAETAGGWWRASAGRWTSPDEATWLVGSGGYSGGGWMAWCPKLQLGVGIALTGDFPSETDPAHPLRELSRTIMLAAEAAADEAAAKEAADAAAE